MVVLLIICTCVLTVCAIKWIRRDKKIYNFAEQLPGPKAYAVIGSAHKFIRKNEQERFQLMRSILDKYEDNKLVRFWLGPALFIFVNDPKLIEQVLESSKCLEKSFLYKFLKLEKGLLAAKHETWQGHRKILECSFKQQMVKSFIPIFADSADQMLTILQKHEDKCNVDLFAVTSRCALTMVLATSFGLSAAEVHFNDEIIKAVEELIKIISKRCHEPILYIERIYRVTRTNFREKKYRKRCYTYFDQVVKDRRDLMPLNNNLSDVTANHYVKDEELGEPSIENRNFIDQLLLQNKEFSDEEIHDHIYTIVAAGYETTALQATYTLLLLAMHPDEQEKVYGEILAVFPTAESTMNQESLDQLKYLNLVIKESSRLLPPVPLIGRETLEDFDLNDVVVPKGVTLVINFFNLHRRKDIWGEDANEFNPERFLRGNEAKRHSHCFLPFSAGPRDCIGKNYAMLATRTILVKFLRKYKISTDLKYDEIKFKADLTLKTCDKISVKIEER